MKAAAGRFLPAPPIEAYMPLSETTARVKFVAKARDDAGNMITLKENSRFVKENGRWYYIDGILS